MRLPSLAIAAVQLVVVVWIGYEMFRNYGRYGRADHGNALAWGAVLIVLLTTVQQIIDVTDDPSRTIGWVMLGVWSLCSLVAVVVSIRMHVRERRRVPRP